MTKIYTTHLSMPVLNTSKFYGITSLKSISSGKVKRRSPGMGLVW
jgi:hypothetical protein